MSILNGINDWGINQFLARRLNITDSPAPASSLAPEVFPVLQALAPSQEDGYLQGIRYCGASAVVTAAALQYPSFAIENSVGSGILVMVDRVVLSYADVATSLDFYVEDLTFMPGLGASGTGVRDSRWRLGVSKRAQALWRTGSDPNAPNISWVPFMRVRWAAVDSAPSAVYDVNATLAPGSCFMVRDVDPATTVSLSILWRERTAQPSELV